jgi:phytoene dehydrogenase-like protein
VAGPERFDVVVVGAGFGGLGAALRLAEGGARVVLLEALNYPGGCASTFTRSGYRFEAGATLSSGLAPGQLFQRWIQAHGLDVPVDVEDPMLRFRTPDLELEVGPDRDALRAQLVELGVPAEPLDRLLARQRRVADTLWALLDDPALLPPLSPSALLRHLRRSPRYLTLLPLLGRPLGALLTRYGLADAAPLRAYLDGLCQITVQCAAAEAEAPFALGAMDYYARGAGHVRGGLGRLAGALVQAIQGLGGEVRFASRVRGVRPGPGGWVLQTRQGDLHTGAVVANLLPQALQGILHEVSPPPDLAARAAAVATGWGAAMLYLVVAPPADAGPGAIHIEGVADPRAPFVEGNHVFASVSGAADEGRCPPGLRTMTVSTHVPVARVEAGGGAYVAEVQATMRRTLGAMAPEWVRDVRFELTASPRTFQRFTGRPQGWVGGVPRRAGLHHYLQLGPVTPLPGLYLVGDSVFPGQSTLAAALSGVKAAERILSG